MLVQGSNLSGPGMFDFSHPGAEDYSIMDALVAAGFPAVTFAIRGYGKSELNADPFTVTTEAAVEDLDAVMARTPAQGPATPLRGRRALLGQAFRQHPDHPRMRRTPMPATIVQDNDSPSARSRSTR